MRFLPRPVRVCATLVLVLLISTACGAGLPPVFPSPAAEPVAAVPPPAATAAGDSNAVNQPAPTDQVEVVMQQSNTPQPAESPLAKLEGTVTYLSRMALPPNSVIEVKLEDISRADAPSIVMASQTIELQGQQVPIPYVLEYDPAKINPAMRYVVSARITENGKLTWISTTMHPALTRGAPKNDIEITVDRVRSN